MTRTPLLALAAVIALACAPTAAAQRERPSPVENDVLTVFITADGAVLVDGTEIAPEALADELRAIAERRRKSDDDDVVVSGDTGAAFDDVFRVMKLIEEAGLGSAYVTVDPE